MTGKPWPGRCIECAEPLGPRQRKFHPRCGAAFRARKHRLNAARRRFIAYLARFAFDAATTRILIERVVDRTSYRSAAAQCLWEIRKRLRRGARPYKIRHQVVRAYRLSGWSHIVYGPPMDVWVDAGVTAPKDVIDALLDDERRHERYAHRVSPVLPPDQNDEEGVLHPGLRREGVCVRINDDETENDEPTPDAAATPIEKVGAQKSALRRAFDKARQRQLNESQIGVLDLRQDEFRRRHLEGVWIEVRLDEPGARDRETVKIVGADNDHAVAVNAEAVASCRR